MKEVALMTGSFYHEQTTIGRLFAYLADYFPSLTRPTARASSFLVIAIIATQGLRSIRSLFIRFLQKVSPKSLNIYYHVCQKAHSCITDFARATIAKSIPLIDDSIRDIPVLLLLDDTLTPKFGKRFDDVRILFDHAAKDKDKYINGHCFVCLTLAFPIIANSRISWVSVPLMSMLWDKSQTKHQMAVRMVESVMPSLCSKRVFLVFDSWYANKLMFSLADKYDDLDIICNARSNTVMYEPAPGRTGKRGRPKKRGDRVVLSQIPLSGVEIGRFKVNKLNVSTNLSGERIISAFVTEPKDGGGRRLFLSTADCDVIARVLRECSFTDDDMPATGDIAGMLPYFLYAKRWSIEVGFYEMKTFWDMGRYMVRRKDEIEALVNLIGIAYGMMKILPLADEAFSDYRGLSPQEVRRQISEQILEQRIFVQTALSLRSEENYFAIVACLRSLIFRFSRAA